MKYHHCHMFGHYKNECPRLKNKKEGKSSSNVVSVEEQSNNSNIVLTVSYSSGCFGGKWVMDSACTFHMCSRTDWFTTYESVNGDSILVVNDMACDIVGIGSVEIKMYDGTIRVLSNVRHIPSLKKNLISLGILDSFGYQYSVADGVIRVYKGSSVVMTRKKTNSLYFLQSSTLIGGAASSDIPNSGTMNWDPMIRRMLPSSMTVVGPRTLRHLAAHLVSTCLMMMMIEISLSFVSPPDVTNAE